MDNNEYPTDEQLQAILDFKGSPHELIKYVNSIWWHDGFTIKSGRDDFRKGVKRCYLSTWGWSGNEDIITVLKQTWFWMLWWRESRRGGHYTFEVPNDSYLKSLTSVGGLESFGLPHSSINDAGKEKNVDRFEVIDDTGRAYVKGSIYGSPVKVELSYQDDDKTLKVFVSKR